MKKQNTQQDIVDYLTSHPCSTEDEIFLGAFGYSRYRRLTHSNKKYAELLRRTLRANKIGRIKVKFKTTDTRMYFRYFIK
jgi:hypothetical protein